MKQRPGGTAKEDVVLLQQLEEINDYPPRLMLEIIRTELARNHLKTDVIVKGVDQELKTIIFALCPGYNIEYYIISNYYYCDNNFIAVIIILLGVPEAASVSDLPPSKEHISHHASKNFKCTSILRSS